MFKLDLEKAEEPEFKLPTSIGSFKKWESFRKTFTSVLLTMPKLLAVWITTNWKILKEMGIPDHLTYLLKNVYTGQEQQLEPDMEQWTCSKLGKQGCILFPFYVEYITWNAWLDEVEAGIKIAGRNIKNLRYADDTTLMAESEEELKSLLMKVKVESENVGLKLNIQKTKIMASGPITSWQIDGETVETVADFIFLSSKITADGECSHESKRCCSLEEKLWPT